MSKVEILRSFIELIAKGWEPFRYDVKPELRLWVAIHSPRACLHLSGCWLELSYCTTVGFANLSSWDLFHTSPCNHPSGVSGFEVKLKVPKEPQETPAVISSPNFSCQTLPSSCILHIYFADVGLTHAPDVVLKEHCTWSPGTWFPFWFCSFLTIWLVHPFNVLSLDFPICKTGN